MTKLLLTLTAAAAFLAPIAQDHHGQMNTRGEQAMGFDQKATTHHFYLYEDGGSIQVTVNDAKDKTNLDSIRMHLPHIAKMFASGDFSAPHFVHAEHVPGTETMTRLRDRISYAYGEIAEGGRVRITTQDAAARAAIHDFLKYQITDHQTGDAMEVISEKPRLR
jgi:hypothetical protein